MDLLIVLLAVVWCFNAWRHPHMPVFWFAALLPTYLVRTHLGPLPTTALELFWAATIIGVTLKQGIRPWREGLGRLRAWWIPAILWVIASAIGIFVAPNHLAALGLWRAYILEPVLYFVLLAGTLRDDRDKRIILESLLASLAVVTLWAVVQFVSGHFIPHPWDTGLLTRRATGPFPYPNALSLFAVPLAALFFGLALFRKGIPLSHRQAWAGFAFGVLDTVLAKSVGGFVGLASCVVLALLVIKKTRWWTVLASVVVAVSLCVIPVTRTKIISTFSFHEWSGKVRTIIWNETANMLKDHPIFGAGFGAYPDVIKPYHTATYLEIFQYPHDILLNLWSETGLLGILAFAWICVVWWKETKGTRWFFALPLLAMLVHGLVDVPYFKNDLAMLFWILAALATFRIKRADAKQDPATRA